MKKTKVLYWIFTGLMAAFMFFSSIGHVTMDPEAVKMMHADLGYPEYIVPFLGVAKILGVIVILIPGLPRLKEWAYAGLVFDLVGAMYSVIALGAPFSQWVWFILFLLPLALSYIYHHKLLKEKEASVKTV
jgi:hypothetical protein